MKPKKITCNKCKKIEEQRRNLQRIISKRDIEIRELRKLKEKCIALENKNKSLAQKIVHQNMDTENIYRVVKRIFGENAVSRIKYYINF